MDPKRVHRSFVDEAGDLNLFDKKGRLLLGTPGVSSFFLVGVAVLHDAERANTRLEELRAALLIDPYFNGVPSMQPGARRTAMAFHAKDDLPEVRREVFRLLPELGAQVQVAFRRKALLAQEAQTLFRYGRKLKADDVYDDLIKRLFRNLLHKADRNHITFAHRGKSARKDALENAITKAKRNFALRTGQRYDVPTDIYSGYPSEHAGLQVVDYYLWALQRLLEVREDRFFRLLEGGFRLIMDIDDKCNREYGEWYSDHNPLTIEKLKDPRTD